MVVSLSPIAFLRPALDMSTVTMREKWDDSGYPCGLKGTQIPHAARIFAAVDIWDALRSDRPYRKAWSGDHVLEFINSRAGTQLAPVVVQALLQHIHARESPVAPTSGLQAARNQRWLASVRHTEAFSNSAGLIRASYLERSLLLESRIRNDKSPIRPWGQLDRSLGEQGTAPQFSTHEHRLGGAISAISVIISVGVARRPIHASPQRPLICPVAS